MLDRESCYRALGARDRRFDGVFFVGVTTTGIYCRPVCPARTPRQNRCHFFPSAAAAERAGLRPCLRCRPELAPGRAPVDASSRVAHAVTARISDGETLRLTLQYRPPLAWAELLQFLAARTLVGVECVADWCYARTVAIGEHRGWLRVRPDAKQTALIVEVSASLSRVLPALLGR